MTRVALYARYSSDNQREASIQDQFRVCREYAEREAWRIVATYHDAAISGDSVVLRPGIQAVLADAQGGKFDLVLAEALDRMSRDQAVVAIVAELQRIGTQLEALGNAAQSCRAQWSARPGPRRAPRRRSASFEAASIRRCGGRRRSATP